ncbi:MAG: NAD-dependent epimerase/dehydratase family protein [Caldithrix sp.]|nr:NAD-dependent epimerase/dehydratase family protein [Caldithrix sp.]
MQTILVTGAAGFIGYHTCQQLLNQSFQVIGIDNLNPYYDVQLKKDRIAQIKDHEQFTFHHMDITDASALQSIFEANRPQLVIHLAAQPGVRYALDYPQAYIQSNLVGFSILMEIVRSFHVDHCIFASSSSVYGANAKMPFSEHDVVDHPVSLYAATKKSNEVIAHTYSHLFSIPLTGLRFFTVYGPWGRPDMAMFKFTKAIFEGNAIDVYNHGDMERDFTYVDDIVNGILAILNQPPQGDSRWSAQHPDPASSYAPYRIYNIGNNQPEKLMYLIRLLEKGIGKKAKQNLLPLQPGDVKQTYADITDLQRSTGFKPTTSLDEGVAKFIQWYKEYYKL